MVDLFQPPNEDITYNLYRLASNSLTIGGNGNIEAIITKCSNIFPTNNFYRQYYTKFCNHLFNADDKLTLKPDTIKDILDYYDIPTTDATPIMIVDGENLDTLNQICIAALHENYDLLSQFASEYNNNKAIVDYDEKIGPIYTIPLNENTFTNTFFKLEKEISTDLPNNQRRNQRVEYFTRIKNDILKPIVTWLVNKYTEVKVEGVGAAGEAEGNTLIDLYSPFFDTGDKVHYINKFTDKLFDYLISEDGFDNEGIIELNLGSTILDLNLKQGRGKDIGLSFSYNEALEMATILKKELEKKDKLIVENVVAKYTYAEYKLMFKEITTLFNLKDRAGVTRCIGLLDSLYKIASTNRNSNVILKNKQKEKYSIDELLEECSQVAIKNPTNIDVTRIYLLGKKIGYYMTNPELLETDLNNAIFLLTGQENEDVQLFKKVINGTIDPRGITTLTKKYDELKSDDLFRKQVFCIIATTREKLESATKTEEAKAKIEEAKAKIERLKGNVNGTNDELLLFKFNATYDEYAKAEKAAADAAAFAKKNRNTAATKGGSRWGRKQRIKITPLKSKSKSKTKKHMRHRHKTMRKQKHNQKSKHRKSIARNTKQRKHTIRQNIADSDSILVVEMVNDLIDESWNSPPIIFRRNMQHIYINKIFFYVNSK